MRRKTFVTWLLILIALPWPIDYWHSWKSARQDVRYDELVFLYECNYRSECLADFDGDRDFARFITEPCEKQWGCLTVREGDREIFRIPYDLTDNTLRTHVAVSEDADSSRLLIYDGISYKPPLKAAFGYNGERLVEVAPTSLEREILDAMEANDDAGGWNERVERDLIRVLRFFIYYALLIVLAGVTMIWGRVAGQKGNPPHNRQYGCMRGVQ